MLIAHLLIFGEVYILCQCIIHFLCNSKRSLFIKVMNKFLIFLISLFMHSVTQPCLTLWDPMDGRTLGYSVQGIFQARILEWVAISYSRASAQARDQTQVSCNSCRDRPILCHWATWEAHSFLSVECVFPVCGLLFNFAHDAFRHTHVYCCFEGLSHWFESFCVKVTIFYCDSFRVF